uniref:PALP domain-containing protein n=1 Tax=Heterorhabditis bacteriophora TaxID=37862 RepID=A0A1I7WNV0_HETBA
MFYDPSATSITWENSGISQDGIKINARPDSKSLKWYNNILEANGNTPLSKLNKIPQAAGIKCNIYVKLEYLNVGGSLEDRAAIRMLEKCARILMVDVIVVPVHTGAALCGISKYVKQKLSKCKVTHCSLYFKNLKVIKRIISLMTSGYWTTKLSIRLKENLLLPKSGFIHELHYILCLANVAAYCLTYTL